MILSLLESMLVQAFRSGPDATDIKAIASARTQIEVFESLELLTAAEASGWRALLEETQLTPPAADAAVRAPVTALLADRERSVRDHREADAYAQALWASERLGLLDHAEMCHRQQLAFGRLTRSYVPDPQEVARHERLMLAMADRGPVRRRLAGPPDRYGGLRVIIVELHDCWVVVWWHAVALAKDDLPSLFQPATRLTADAVAGVALQDERGEEYPMLAPIAGHGTRTRDDRYVQHVGVVFARPDGHSPDELRFQWSDHEFLVRL